MRPLLAVDNPNAAAEEFARVYQLTDVAPHLHAMAAASVRDGFTTYLREGGAAALAETWAAEARATGPGRLTLDAAQRARVEAALKARLQAALPDLAHQYVYDRLLNGALGEQRAEVEAMAQAIAARATTSINAQLDTVVGEYYDRAMSLLEVCRADSGIIGDCPLPAGALLLEPRQTIEALLTTDRLRDVIERPLREALGNGTMDEIRTRMETALAGALPPEVIGALREGPERFREAVATARAYLPTNVIGGAVQKIKHLPVISLPNAVYAGILMGSAAMHFSRVICGPTCVNLYEFQRGNEVVDVLLWQLSNRERIILNVGQLLDALTKLGRTLGLPPISEWGRLGKDLTAAKERLTDLRGQLQRLDAQAMQPLDRIQGELDAGVRAAERELKELQQQVLTPVREFVDGVNTGVASARDAITSRLPEQWRVPRSWAAFKEQTHLDGTWLGQWGEQTPLDLVGMGDVPAHLSAAARDINAQLSGRLAEGATAVLDATGLLPLTAQILPETRVPALEPSLSNAFDPVLLHNGEFAHRVVDLRLPARGDDIEFVRTYRSRHDFTGSLGRNWTHNYYERLLTDASSHDVTWFDAAGRKWMFRAHSDGTWRAPRGIFAILCRPEHVAIDLECQAAPFVLLHPDGRRTEFDAQGRVVARVDGAGNRLTMEYDDARDRLVVVRDPVGRRLRLFYDAAGRIAEVRDWIERRWQYTYDGAGDLVRAASPAAVPSGIAPATHYRYSATSVGATPTHHLVEIRDPKGQVYLANTYGETGIERDRVIAQQYGHGDAPIRARYRLLRPGWWNAAAATLEVEVTDQVGVTRRYHHNATGELIAEWVRGRDGAETPVFQAVYTREGAYARYARADGVVQAWQYDETAPDRRAHGNWRTRTERGTQGGVREWRAVYSPTRQHLHALTDPIGRVTTWRYAREQPVELQQPDGGRWRWETASTGEILAMTDPAGHRTAWSYDQQGLPAQMIRDPGGLRLTASRRYDDVGNLVQFTAADGTRTQYRIDGRNRVTEIVAPARPREQFAYDMNDNIIRMERGTGPSRAVQELQYDSRDRLVQRREWMEGARWRATQYRYRGPHLVRVDRPLGNWIGYDYAAHGALATVRAGGPWSARLDLPWWGARLWHWRYDAAGRPVAVQEGERSAVRLEYDEFSQLRRRYVPTGAVETITRDALGRVVASAWETTAGAPLAATRRHYDLNDRVIARQRAWWRDDPATAEWITDRYAWDPVGRLHQWTDPLGAVVTLHYDAAGRVTTARHSGGVERTWAYDAVDRTVATTLSPPAATQRMTYDRAGRLIAHTDPIGARWTYAYDTNGSLLSVRDPESRVVRYAYDRLGRRTTRQEDFGPSGRHAANPDGVGTIAFDWDDNDRLAALTTDRGEIYRWTYDTFDHLAGIDYPDGGHAAYRAMPDGRWLHRRDPAGHRVEYTFDEAGRLQSLFGQSHATDVASVRQTFAYDPLGRLRTAREYGDPADPSASHDLEFHYDSLGRQFREVQGDMPIEIAHDAAGRVTERRMGERLTEQRRYDPLGRLTAVVTPTTRVALHHDGWATNTRIDFDNVLHKRQTYDLAGRVQHERFQTATGDTVWGATYRYDRSGLVQAARESNGSSWNYAYDGGRRLIRADQQSPGDRVRQWTWRYDGDGGWSSATHDGHAIVLSAMTWDARGARRSDDRNDYRFDVLGRLRALQPHVWYRPRQTYAYDALSRRIRDGATRVQYAGWQEWAIQSTGDGWRHLIAGNALDALFAIRSLGAMGDTQYLLPDRQHSIRGTVDGRGQLYTRTDYAPYGERLTPSAEPAFGYTGRPHSNDDRIHLRLRDYDPHTGQFLTRDPLGLKQSLDTSVHAAIDGSRYTSPDSPGAGPTRGFEGTPFWSAPAPSPDTVEGDVYMYARNNPLAYTDPYGLWITITPQGGNRYHVLLTGEIKDHPDLPPNFGHTVEQGVERYYEGIFANTATPGDPPYRLTVDAQFSVVEKWDDPEAHRITIGNIWGGARAYVPNGTRRMKIDRDTLGEEDLDRTIAHEVGHWFGLPDQYDRKLGQASSGYEENLMGCLSSSSYQDSAGKLICTLNGNGHDDIHEILSHPEHLNQGIRRPGRQYLMPDYKG